MNERLLVVLGILALIALLWLVWQGVKWWLRQSISAESGNGRPRLVYISGENCAECRLRQAPVIAELRRQWGDRLYLTEYAVESHPEAASRYRVLTLPTTVVLSADGRVIAHNHGFTSLAKLKRQLQAAAGREPAAADHAPATR